MYFWNKHEQNLNQRLTQMSQDSKLPNVKNEFKDFLSNHNESRIEAEKYFAEIETYRNKELKKLEKQDKIKDGPSVDFKKRNLDFYL